MKRCFKLTMTTSKTVDKERGRGAGKGEGRGFRDSDIPLDPRNRCGGSSDYSLLVSSWEVLRWGPELKV